MFCKLWFCRNLINKTTLLFYMCLHTYLCSCFHDWKRENLICEVTLKSLLDCYDRSCLYAHHVFEFLYRYTIDKIARSLFLWHSYLRLCLQDCGDILLIKFMMHWWFGFICSLIDSLGTLKTRLCFGKTLGIKRFIQRMFHITKPLVRFWFIALVLKL